jgi:hypothetical protein
MSKVKWLFLTLALVSALVLTGCAGSSNAPADAVAAYWQAMVAKDGAQLSSLSCAAYEAQSLITMESFGAFEPVLSDLTCEVIETSGDTASVKCSGKIEVSYGAEILTIDLADRNYAAVKEGGDWRMCGTK